jgi:predicted nucleic acid-binding protein
MRPGSSGKTGNRTDVFLLDAGVWVAARDPEDAFHSAAREVVLDFARPVAALDLTFYEVANVMGGRKGQVGEARYLLRTLEIRCGEDIVAVSAQSIDAVLELAIEHDLTAYDAAYVAAARRHGWTLVSTDVADLVSRGLAVSPGAADYP